MATEPKSAKLTDEQRHARSVEMARELGASEDSKAFDRAFEAVAKPSEKPVSDDD